MATPEPKPTPAPDLEPRTTVIRFDLLNVALAATIVVVVLQAFHFLSVIQSVLVLLLLAIILATAIEPIVFRLRRLGFQRGVGVLLIYFVFVGIVGVFLYFLLQVVVQQLSALAQALPGLLIRLSQLVNALPAGLIRNAAAAAFSSATSSTAANVQGVPSEVSNSTVTGLVGFTLSLFAAIFAVVTIFVIAYFWIDERLTIRRMALRLVRTEHRQRAFVVWDNAEKKFGAWARGQLALMLIVGVVQGLGYAVLGLNFALLLGVWAGIAEIIPILGPYIGAAPALIVALSQSPATALFVAIYTVAVNLLEANILVPRIMERAVGLSPLAVILAILAGAELYGIIGALLAVPVAAAIQATIVELAAASNSEGGSSS
jgi:predicted PurR-regulated permease PerM